MGGIGSAWTNGVVAGLWVGFGEHTVGSGGGGGSPPGSNGREKLFLEVKTVNVPAAAPSLSAVLRVIPFPFVSSASFFFGFLDFSAGSCRVFFIATPFGGISFLFAGGNPEGTRRHTSPSSYRLK